MLDFTKKDDLAFEPELLPNGDGITILVKHGGSTWTRLKYMFVSGEMTDLYGTLAKSPRSHVDPMLDAAERYCRQYEEEYNFRHLISRDFKIIPSSFHPRYSGVFTTPSAIVKAKSS